MTIDTANLGQLTTERESRLITTLAIYGILMDYPDTGRTVQEIVAELPWRGQAYIRELLDRLVARGSVRWCLTEPDRYILIPTY